MSIYIPYGFRTTHDIFEFQEKAKDALETYFHDLTNRFVSENVVLFDDLHSVSPTDALEWLRTPLRGHIDLPMGIRDDYKDKGLRIDILAFELQRSLINSLGENGLWNKIVNAQFFKPNTDDGYIYGSLSLTRLHGEYNNRLFKVEDFIEYLAGQGIIEEYAFYGYDEFDDEESEKAWLARGEKWREVLAKKHGLDIPLSTVEATIATAMFCQSSKTIIQSMNMEMSARRRISNLATILNRLDNEGLLIDQEQITVSHLSHPLILKFTNLERYKDSIFLGDESLISQGLKEDDFMERRLSP